MHDIRIPVVQILLFLYFIGSAFVAYKTKRKSLWVLCFLTFISFVYHLVMFFIFPAPVYKGFIGFITEILLGWTTFLFIIFPLWVTIEAIMVRSKYLKILAFISVSISIVWFILFYTSSM